MHGPITGRGTAGQCVKRLPSTVQMAISVSWYTLVGLAVGLVRRTLARPSVKTRVEQISGLVLVGLGLRMITLSRAAL
jgi:threonine/homoserine/homoserine lactone efflux protein